MSRSLKQGSHMSNTLAHKKERAKVEWELEGIKYRFWRLDDTEFWKLRQDSVPIKEVDYWFYRSLYNYRGLEQDKLDLPRLFVVLEYKFGKSGSPLDDWKGSFSFPFLVLIEKDSETLYYMMKVADLRGRTEYRMYKIFIEGIGDIDNDVYKKPFDEFPEEEIEKLIGCFYGFYLGYFRAVKREIEVQPFFKKIDSNFIIYGYQDNDYFEEYYDNEEDYKAAVKGFEEKYPKVPEQRNVGAMIQEIIS